MLKLKLCKPTGFSCQVCDSHLGFLTHNFCHLCQCHRIVSGLSFALVFYYSGESGEPLFWNRQEGLNVVAGAYFTVMTSCTHGSTHRMRYLALDPQFYGSSSSLGLNIWLLLSYACHTLDWYQQLSALVRRHMNAARKFGQQKSSGTKTWPARPLVIELCTVRQWLAYMGHLLIVFSPCRENAIHPSHTHTHADTHTHTYICTHWKLSIYLSGKC